MLLFIKLVPRAGIEPARPQWPQDFKSCVSTSSTTRAGLVDWFINSKLMVVGLSNQQNLHKLKKLFDILFVLSMTINE